MARGPVPFKQIDVTRAVKGVVGAGEKVARVEIDGSRITIFTAEEGASSSQSTPFDQWEKRRGSRPT